MKKIALIQFQNFTKAWLLVACFSIAMISILFSLAVGSATVSLSALINIEQLDTIIWQLRFPRTLCAFVSGALLALAGSFMQVLLQNPLADPFVLGISSSAALATLLLMLLGVTSTTLIFGSWVGSLIATFLMLALARKHRWQHHSLLLIGIALASAFSAGISLVLTISPNANLHSMLFWLMGDLNNSQFPFTGIVVLMLGILSAILLAPGLNILTRGEYESQAIGLAIKPYRISLYLLSSLFTATAVTQVGCIGFIGLIIPHISRLFIGTDHRFMLPVAILLGGSLLTIADTLARCLIAPQQLPVGIMMTLIGVPIFIWLLQHE